MVPLAPCGVADRINGVVHYDYIFVPFSNVFTVSSLHPPLGLGVNSDEQKYPPLFLGVA